MSQGIGQHELQEKTQKLLQGPLKHVRAAALAAVLLPLASVAAAPAAAQDCPPSSGGTVCGFVWNDTDGDGIQDSGEGIPNSKVTLGSFTSTTDGDGFYIFMDVPAETYVVTVDANQDGTTDNFASVNVTGFGIFYLDFGFTPSGGSSDGEVSGVVWDDLNNNGVQDAGEEPIEGAKVFVCHLCDGTDTVTTETGTDGTYSLLEYPGTYTLSVLIPTETKTSPSNVGDDTFDSDGVPDGFGYSVVSVRVPEGAFTITTDFGFSPSVQQPGTGTPGYWKNHPDAWPAAGLTVGGVYFTKAQAIWWLGKVGTDKTTTMFSSLVPAMLNVMIGNDGCVNSAIALANSWMADHHVGTNVAASSAAWAIGSPLHMTLDAYNNGLFCAPHRN